MNQEDNFFIQTAIRIATKIYTFVHWPIGNVANKQRYKEANNDENLLGGGNSILLDAIFCFCLHAIITSQSHTSNHVESLCLINMSDMRLVTSLFVTKFK